MTVPNRQVVKCPTCKRDRLFTYCGEGEYRCGKCEQSLFIDPNEEKFSRDELRNLRTLKHDMRARLTSTGED